MFSAPIIRGSLNERVEREAVLGGGSYDGDAFLKMTCPGNAGWDTGIVFCCVNSISLG